MKSKIMKMLVAALALASFSLMGCEEKESGKDVEKAAGALVKNADGPVDITVKDADGNVYPAVKIGDQIWMAKNLNVNVPGSACYENDPTNCEKYGRLYTWEAARNACPSGWHLPSKEEMNDFVRAVDVRIEQIVTQKELDAVPLREGERGLYNHLRDASWREGFDSFGFSALPAGGYGSSDKRFGSLGDNTGFWSSSEDNDISGAAYFLGISDKTSLSADALGSLGYRVVNLGDKYGGNSVRCLQDSN